MVETKRVLRTSGRVRAAAAAKAAEEEERAPARAKKQRRMAEEVDGEGASSSSESEASDNDERDASFEVSGRKRRSPASARSRQQKRVSAPNPSKRTKLAAKPQEDASDSDSDSDGEEDYFRTRSSAASTAKRCCAMDGEGRVDLCVKILAQACGLGAGSSKLLGEARLDRGEDEDEDAGADEDTIYRDFGRSLAAHLASEARGEGEGRAGTDGNAAHASAQQFSLLFGKRSKQLENNFVHFWNQLVMLLHGKETLYASVGSGSDDDSVGTFASATDLASVDFLGCIKHVCVELSKSEVRSIRYAACVCGYALLGSLVHAHQVLDESNVLLTKQLRAVGNGGGSQKKKEQRRDLNKRLHACHERSNLLDLCMKELFQELAIVRFRDVAPAIRALTIKWVGLWVVQHPKKFLSDGYLKYVAWSLNDKDAHVRLAAVEALREVYQKHGEGRGNNASGSLANGSALDLLTQRFSKRYCELVRDKNPSVALSAILLVVAAVGVDMISVDEHFVHSELDEYLALLLLDRSNKICRAAGQLAAVVIDKRAAQEQEQRQRQQAKKKKGGARSKQKGSKQEEDLARIRATFEALGELVDRPLSPSAEDEDGGEVGGAGASMATELQVAACAAVVPHLPFLMEDWDLLAKATLSCTEEEERESALRAVLACVRANNSHSGGQGAGRKAASKRKPAAGAGSASVEQVTLAFAQPISVLFAQCKGSRNAALTTLLSGLLSEMKLELFVARREEAQFSSILRCLVDIGRSNAATLTDNSSSSSDGGDMESEEEGGSPSSSSSREARLALSAVTQCLGHLCSVGPQVTRDKAQAAAAELVGKCRKARGPAINVLLSTGLYRPDITAGEAKEEYEGLLASLQGNDGGEKGGKKKQGKGQHGVASRATAAETAALMLLWTLQLKRREGKLRRQEGRAEGLAAEAEAEADGTLLGQEAGLFVNALLSSKSSGWASFPSAHWLLPSWFTSCHHRSPTSMRPLTFFTCARPGQGPRQQTNKRASERKLSAVVQSLLPGLRARADASGERRGKGVCVCGGRARAPPTADRRGAAPHFHAAGGLWVGDLAGVDLTHRPKVAGHQASDEDEVHDEVLGEPLAQDVRQQRSHLAGAGGRARTRRNKRKRRQSSRISHSAKQNRGKTGSEGDGGKGGGRRALRPALAVSLSAPPHPP